MEAKPSDRSATSPPGMPESAEHGEKPGFARRARPAKIGAQKLNPDLLPKLVPRDELSRHEIEAAWGAGDASTSKRRSNRRTAVIATAAFLCVLSISFGLISMINQDAETARAGTAAVVAKPSEDYFAAKEAVQAFVDAASIEERLPLVRHPEESEPLMRQYYENHAIDSHQIAAFNPRASVDSAFGMELVWLDFQTPDLTWQTAIFEKTGDGLKLDWENFVLFEEVPWTEFIVAGSEVPGIFRVAATRDTYFNYRYDEEDAFLCVRLEDPRKRGSCWAYAEKESSVDVALRRLFERAGRSQQENEIPAKEGAIDSAGDLPDSLKGGGQGLEIRVMLQLRFIPHHDGSAHSQAWIDSVVSDSWFVPRLPAP